MKLKFFVLALSLAFSFPLFSQTYSDYSDEQLIRMLEQELNAQEQLANRQEEQLNSLREQLNSLRTQLQLADESCRNLKKDTMKNKIIIGSACFLGGFFAGSMIVCLNRK